MSRTLRLSIITVMLLSSTALGLIAYNSLNPALPPPSPEPAPTPVVVQPPPEPAPTPVIIMQAPPPPPVIVYREVRSAVEEKYTKGFSIPGSNSTSYGIFGRATDRRNRDVLGASDVVASDSNGNSRPRVYTVANNLKPGEEIKWMYDIATLQSDGGSGFSYVQKTPYKWYANKDECMVDRARRITELEAVRDKDGNIIQDKNNQIMPVTRPARAWRAITGPTILTDAYSKTDYNYQYGYGRNAGGSTNSDGSGSWGSNSGAGATANETSRSGTVSRLVRGMWQAYLPGDCAPKVVVRVPVPPTISPQPDEMDLPEPPMTPPSKK